MRDKAAFIFQEIATIQALSPKAPLTTIRELTLAEQPTLSTINTDPDRLSQLRALLAVYFPEVLLHVAAYDVDMIEAMKSITAKFTSLSAATSAEKASALTAFRFEIEVLIWRKQLQLCSHLHKAMVEAVKPYTPRI